MEIVNDVTRTLALPLFGIFLNNWTFTNEIRNETSIGEPACRILEEWFSIRPPICLVLCRGVNVVVISRIEQWVTEHEEGSLRSANTHNWVNKTSKKDKDAQVKQAWVQSHWCTLEKTKICTTLPLLNSQVYYILNSEWNDIT